MRAHGYRERPIYSRRCPSEHASNVNGIRRHRRNCRRCFTSIQSIVLLVFVSFLFIGYWIGQTTYVSEAWTGKSLTVQAMSMTPVRIRRPTLARMKSEPLIHELAVEDVVDPISIQSLDSSRLAFYVFCGERNSIEYVQYLSLASVTRFFDPSHLVFLYETETPTLQPGNWTTMTGMDDLLRQCTVRLVTHRMSNASLICRDTIKMREFIMKLLFRFGGLYVGRTTVMTEMANFMRPTITDDHLLSHIEDDLEGFIYVKKPLTTNELPENQRKPASRPFDQPPQPSQGPSYEVKYITSRQLSCQEALRAKEGEVHHACLIIRETLTADPLEVVQMRSAFGSCVRKAIFNFVNEQQMQNYRISTNTSATPPLCSKFQ